MAFGGAEHAKIAGLLHDLGKAEDEFQKRLRSDDKEGDKEPHAHHGAMIALEKEAWPIALAINGHHAGLHNRGDVFAKMNGYLGKAKVSAAALHESDASWSLPEIAEVIPHWLKDLTFNGQRSSDGWMATELFTRFLFSALIDADRLDAEHHEKALDERNLSPQSFEKKWGGPNLRRDWPGFDAQLLLDKLERNLGERAENALREGKASADVLRVRNEVGDWCRRNAASERGLFSLAVPTGGGKTLASMLFALSHAAHHSGQLEAEDPHRFRRVIVVIP
ncbi:MAG TPA: CRISPR-associated endonuclease Cas3'', partial [Pyrinomonadaceae bacterium]|nr:CRISPR-associated endonuclease Cas3'' [Pyrinomonadaceae bacterium]